MTIGFAPAAASRRRTASTIRTATALALLLTLGLAALIGAAAPAMAQFSQQGAKLIGSNYSAPPVGQGTSVAVSADGNTAILGGPYDNSPGGAAWVFTRSGSTWTQQATLIGSGIPTDSQQGWSVALSADGNTALMGAPGDSSSIGAVWVFTRSGSTWTQQAKLVGSGNVGPSAQGYSVALSADGNTALVGGPTDNSDVGAAWVFTRSGSTWTQQAKLVDDDYSGNPDEGYSVALSGDGNTAILGEPDNNSYVGGASIFIFHNRSGWSVYARLSGSGNIGTSLQGRSVALSTSGDTAIIGGPGDNLDIGAVWVFVQSGTTYTQQAELTGSGEVGEGDFGSSAAISADGNTAIVGAEGDNFTGSAWVFAQTGGAWTQQGAKLVGAGSSGNALQGTSVALSADGNTMIEGGPFDSDQLGAAWVFDRTVPTNSHDFDDAGVSDILWRNSGGTLALWLMSAGQELSGANISVVPSNWSVAGTRDFTGTGDADILWLDASGDLAVWLMDGATLSSGINLGNVGTQWSVVGTGDFSGNGVGGILWRNTSTGDLAVWLMSNGQFSSGVDLGVVPLTWQIAGTGDFNGDGTTDILWRNASTGDLAIWFLQNGQFSSGADLGDVPLTWTVVGTGDFNGDGTSDILWRDSSGNIAVWLIGNGQLSSGANLGDVPTTWSVAETGDFDGDGKSDLLWTDGSGDVAVWLMNGLSVSSYNSLGNVGTSWTVQGVNAD